MRVVFRNDLNNPSLNDGIEDAKRTDFYFDETKGYFTRPIKKTGIHRQSFPRDNSQGYLRSDCNERQVAE